MPNSNARKKPAKADDLSRDLLIRTIAGEAGGESASGQAAVAAVIKNRLISGKYGASLEDVILAPKQFSVWNKGDPAGKIARGLEPGSPQYAKIGKIVDSVLAGETQDPTGGAVNYYNPAVANPTWGPGLAQKGAIQIGNHLFVGGRQVPSQVEFPGPTGYRDQALAPAGVMSSTALSPMPQRGNSLLQAIRDRPRFADYFPNGLTGLRGILSNPDWQPSGLTKGLFETAETTMGARSPQQRPMLDTPAETALPWMPEPTTSLSAPSPAGLPPGTMISPAGEGAPAAVPVPPMPKAPDEELQAVPQATPEATPPVDPDSYDEWIKSFDPGAESAPAEEELTPDQQEFYKELSPEATALPSEKRAEAVSKLTPDEQAFWTPTPRHGRGDTRQAIDFAAAAAREADLGPGVLSNGKISFKSEADKQRYFLGKTAALPGYAYTIDKAGLGIPMAIMGRTPLGPGLERMQANYEAQQPGSSLLASVAAPIAGTGFGLAAGRAALGAGATAIRTAAGSKTPSVAAQTALPYVDALGKFFTGAAGAEMGTAPGATLGQNLAGRATRGASYLGTGAAEGAGAGFLQNQLTDSSLAEDVGIGAAIGAPFGATGGMASRWLTRPIMQAERSVTPGAIDAIQGAAKHLSPETLPTGPQISMNRGVQAADESLNIVQKDAQLRSFSKDLAGHLGATDTSLTPKVRKDTQELIGRNLEAEVKKIGLIPHGTIFSDLNNLTTKLRDRYMQTTLANPYLEEIQLVRNALANGPISGEQFRTLTDFNSKIGIRLRSLDGDDRRFGGEIRAILEKNLDDAAVASGQPELPGKIKEQLKKYRNIILMEGVATESGVVSPAKLRAAWKRSYGDEFVADDKNPISHMAAIADFLPEPTSTGEAAAKSALTHPANPVLAVLNRGPLPREQGFGNTLLGRTKQLAAPLVLSGAAYGAGMGALPATAVLGTAAVGAYGLDKMRSSILAELMRSPEYRNLLMGVRGQALPTPNKLRALRGANRLLGGSAIGLSSYERNER